MPSMQQSMVVVVPMSVSMTTSGNDHCRRLLSGPVTIACSSTISDSADSIPISHSSSSCTIAHPAPSRSITHRPTAGRITHIARADPSAVTHPIGGGPVITRVVRSSRDVILWRRIITWTRRTTSVRGAKINVGRIRRHGASARIPRGCASCIRRAGYRRGRSIVRGCTTIDRRW